MRSRLGKPLSAWSVEQDEISVDRRVRDDRTRNSESENIKHPALCRILSGVVPSDHALRLQSTMCTSGGIRSGRIPRGHGRSPYQALRSGDRVWLRVIPRPPATRLQADLCPLSYGELSCRAAAMFKR